MVVDADHVQATPGVVLLQGGEILAAGSPQQVGSVSEAVTEDWTGHVLIPPLVNAHAHLDLTHIGPQPLRGDFVDWIGLIRRLRCTDGVGIGASVREGCRLCRAGGTALVGDIAGGMSDVPAAVMREAGLAGVSFVEVFGLAQRQAGVIESLGRFIRDHGHDEGGVRIGIQPHAPFSCGPLVYRYAAGCGRPISTHLAETSEEVEFCRAGTGLLAGFLTRIGAINVAFSPPSAHPIGGVLAAIGSASMLAAHVNYAEDGELKQLAESSVSVAYCPRASDYFGHRGHRYRDMMAAGINVALGTDSIICLGRSDRISVLDEMRLLQRRDGVSARVLLAMATVNGARALGFDAEVVSLTPGPKIGLLALPTSTRGSDPLMDAFDTGGAPIWAAGPFAVGGVT